MKMTDRLLALQLDPNSPDGGEIGDGRERRREGERKQGRGEEVRQRRKEGTRQSGQRKKGREKRLGEGREGRPSNEAEG